MFADLPPAFQIAAVIEGVVVSVFILLIVASFRPHHPVRDEVETWLADPEDGRRQELQRVFPESFGAHR